MNDNQICTGIPEMLGVRETAERFRISPTYVRQLALSGAVKAVRVGKGKILVNAQSVADYFNSNYITSEEPAPTGNTAGITPIPVKL